LAPCIKAGSSADGSFLVIRDFVLEPGTKEIPGQPLRPKQITLQVYPKEKFINEKDRLVSQATFWTDLTGQWSVILDSHESPISCPNFLISNDGEFLVIFGGGLANGALRIYRRRDHLGDPMREGADHGIFIREVPLKELWPSGVFDQWRKMGFADESPQWFAGGSFEFTADSRQLIYKTQWGNTARIRLEKGSVMND
jgi:hypothetical protein